MKKTVILMIGFLLVAVQGYGASGDFTVGGVLTSTVTNNDAIIFDGGHSRITVHDGSGHFNIKTGADNADKYTVTGDGAAKIVMTHNAADGVIQFKTATTGTAGNTVTWNKGFYQNGTGNVGIRNISPQSTLQVGTPLNATYDYFQLDTFTSNTAGPPSGACAANTDVGKSIITDKWSATAEYRLWTCFKTGATSFAWKYIAYQ
jgi:hypothetical protein